MSLEQDLDFFYSESNSVRFLMCGPVMLKAKVIQTVRGLIEGERETTDKLHSTGLNTKPKPTQIE